LEMQKLRSEQVTASPTGQMGGMGNLGTMGMGGGGMPGGEMGGAEMGGMAGAPGGMGGEMGGGGAPMGPGGMGGAPAGGGMGAAAGSQLPVIGKRGSKSMQEKQQEEAPQMQTVRLTKLEGKMLKMLQSMKLPSELYIQYSVNVPGEQRPFSLDFAYPRLGVGVETDGNIWHEREDFKQRDLNRDQKLANVGWRVLRFREDAVNEQPDAVRDVIYKNIQEAEKSHKKASQDEKIIKYSSMNDINKNPVYDYMINNQNKIGCYRQKISTGIEILYIGEIENGD